MLYIFCKLQLTFGFSKSPPFLYLSSGRLQTQTKGSIIRVTFSKYAGNRCHGRVLKKGSHLLDRGVYGLRKFVIEHTLLLEQNCHSPFSQLLISTGPLTKPALSLTDDPHLTPEGFSNKGLN